MLSCYFIDDVLLIIINLYFVTQYKVSFQKTVHRSKLTLLALIYSTCSRFLIQTVAFEYTVPVQIHFVVSTDASK